MFNDVFLFLIIPLYRIKLIHSHANANMSAYGNYKAAMPKVNSVAHIHVDHS